MRHSASMISSMEGIKRKRDIGSAELMQLAQLAENSNCTHDLMCPGCFRMMEKKTTIGYPKVEYDSCPSCEGVWLDPGELEMLQLVYEASMKGQAEEEMRDEFDEFMTSKERQARFKENLAQCKDPSYTTGAAIKGGIMEAFIDALFRSHTRFRF